MEKLLHEVGKKHSADCKKKIINEWNTDYTKISDRLLHWEAVIFLTHESYIHIVSGKKTLRGHPHSIRNCLPLIPLSSEFLSPSVGSEEWGGGQYFEQAKAGCLC